MNSFRIALIVPLPLIIDLITKLEFGGVRLFLLSSGALGLMYSAEILRSNVSSTGAGFLISAFVFLSLMAFMHYGTFAISILIGFVISFFLAMVLISSKIHGYRIKLINIVFIILFVSLALFRNSFSISLLEQLLVLLFLFWYYAFVLHFERFRA